MRVKSRRFLISTFIFFIFLVPAMLVFAAANSSNIEKDVSISKDYFAFGQRIINEGIVKGDIIFLSQYLKSQGMVEGDIIGIASEVNVPGKVSGDIRVAGINVILSGGIEKNANIFADNASLSETSKIGGNLIAFSNSIELNGSVQGYTRLNCANVVLGGEFYGDVDINLDGKYGDADVAVHILPGAKIHGKLTYKGVNEAIVENGSQIKDVEWIQTAEKEVIKKSSESMNFNVWHYIKILVSALIYFFISLLIYRFFPRTFSCQAEIILEKPLNIIGVGLFAIALIIVSFVTFIFLLAVTVLIASPAIAFIFAAVMALTYIILIYFSTVPVALFLGNLILKNRYSVQWKFGAGLALITLISMFLSFMSNLGFLGILFLTIKFVLSAGIIVVGMGAILYSIGIAFKSLRDV